MNKMIRWIVVGLCVTSLGAGAISHASAEEAGAVIGKGTLKGFDWSVEAAKEGTGICFEVAVEKIHSAEENGVGQCSFPSRRRGILLVVANAQKDSQSPKVVVIGGAFNPAVARVEIVRFNGSVAYLRLRRVQSKLASKTVRRFKYVATVVAGPWCAKTLTTIDKHGHPLWRTNWKLFDVGWWRLPNSNPSKLCPH